MVKSKPKTADEIFSKVEADKKLIAERLRTLIKSVLPKAVESVRRGKITYSLNGKDIAAIRLTMAHVDLLFMNGDRLSGSNLKGQGTIGDPKHITVVTLKNFDEADVKRLLKEEAALVELTG